MVRHLLLLSIALTALLASSPKCAGEATGRQHSKLPDPLIQGFLNPPPEARMRMYWRVFGPAWTREGIDHQLGLLKDAGVGGVMLMPFYPVAVDDPAKAVHNQRFLSPEFLETFAYAAKKAKSLGLRFGVQGGSGWPFGGPTVSLKDAAQRIRRVELKPGTTGSKLSLLLLRSQLHDGEQILASFQGRVRTEWSEWAARGTADPLTLFITGPTYMKVKRPALGADGYVIDHYNTPALERWLDANVKPLLDAAPALVESIFCDSLEVYNSNWTHDLPQQFRKRRGYDIVARLPELFDEKAPASADLRFDLWRTLAEIHEERWTKPLGEWSRRHGVKLEMEEYGTPPSPLTSYRHIDVPTGEQYEWMGFSFSRYAASGGHLAGKRVIGAEAWTWTGLPNRLIDSLRDLKLASDYHFLAGINDLTGVDFAYSPPNVPAPGWLPYFGPVMNQNNPQWPYFKYLVQYVNRCQWLLRQGRPVAQVALYLPVEQSFAHGPIEQMPLDFLLRDHFVTGEKTGEFGLDNARKHRSELIHTLITHGYNFDGIDFWTLVRHAKVKNGKLICGDGEYSIVILPNIEGMELAALEKLVEFVRSGGTLLVTGEFPSHSYGIKKHSEEHDGRLKRLIEALCGNDPDMRSGSHTTSRLGLGRAILVRDPNWLSSALGLTVLRFDAPLGPYGLNPSLGVACRETADYEIAFLSNTAEHPIDVYFGHRVFDDWGSRPVWLLDPALGTAEVATAHGVTAREVYSTLPPLGSTFFLFPRSNVVDERLNRTRLDQPKSVTTDRVRATAGAGDLPPNLKTSVLNPRWTIRFSGPDAPSPVETENLVSWTQWPGGKYFSGQATYETTFDWNETLPVILREPKATEESALRIRSRGTKADSSARTASPQNDGRGSYVRLRFAEVHEAGEVWVNGKRAGGLWLPPYEVEIGPLLKPGKNTLKVTVGNTMLNRFIGLPDEDLGPLRAAYGNRFPNPEEKRITTEPPPSGLIGPVEIIRP